MTQVELPRHHWFINKTEGKNVTNIFYGSVGTDSDTGCVDKKTFNYRVWVDTSYETEAEYRLCAECFIVHPWTEGGKKTDFTKKDFESSDKGVAQAAEWLTEMTGEYGY